MDAIAEMQNGLLAWFLFETGERALYIGDENVPFVQMLERKGLEVCTTRNLKELPLGGSFAYIICIEALEWRTDAPQALRKLYALCKQDGVLLLGMNNRLGIRYFCGDRDPYTHHSFDGIENYVNAYPDAESQAPGHMYAKSEITEMLETAGFTTHKFYAVFPDLSHPFHLYADGVKPNEELNNRITPLYHEPKTVFLEEERLYRTLIQNGLFHAMANAYLIECPKVGSACSVESVTGSTDRAHEDALLTVIKSDKTVEKRAVYPEGEARLDALCKNMDCLRARGVPVIDIRREADAVGMPYIEAETGQLYLQRLLKEDRQKFFAAFDLLMENVRKSTDVDGEDALLGPLAKIGYFDMVPLNTFVLEDRFYYFDQEFAIPHYPISVILARNIFTFYAYHEELQQILPEEELLARYGLLEKKDAYREAELAFLHGLWNENALGAHREKGRRDDSVMRRNRFRMNYAADDFQRFFVDFLADAKEKELILFGSGNYAESFLERFGDDYPVSRILDNNPSRQGETLRGIRIEDPHDLEELHPDAYKVIICMRAFAPVIRQLDELGVRDYSVYRKWEV